MRSVAKRIFPMQPAFEHRIVAKAGWAELGLVLRAFRRINSLIGVIQKERAQRAPGACCPIQNPRVATGDPKLAEFQDTGVARHQYCD